MAWDGNGNFSRIHNWISDRDAAIRITASRHDAEDDNLTTGISACLTKNNETKPTADFRPNANRLYNLGSTTLRWITAFISASIKFRSATASFDTIVAATDATVSDKTITLPNETGTVALRESANTFSGANIFSGANSFTTARQNFYIDASNSAVRIGSSSTNNGGYLTSVAGDSVYLSGGAELVAGAWTARATEAGILSIATDGALRYEYNSGLVAGNTFTPTQRVVLDGAGKMTAGTVPLARMGTSILSGTASVSANTITELSSGPSGDGNFHLLRTYQAGSGRISYGARVTETETVVSGGHAILGSNDSTTYLELVNGTGSTIGTWEYNVYSITES